MTVRTRSGPHVTPELFSTSRDRIVCLTAAATLKARRARSDPFVGFACRSDRGTLAGVARAELLDPVDPTNVLRSPGSAFRSPLDLTRFVRDNAMELSGAAVDAVTGKLGMPPKRRAELLLHPIAAVALGADGQVWSDGWDELDRIRTTAERDGQEEPTTTGVRGGSGDISSGDLDLSALSDPFRSLVTASDVVVGWTRSDGTPLGLPGRWEDGAAFVQRDLFDAAGGVPECPASVTFDTWSGLGPTGKQGVMLRGEGRVTERSGTVRLQLVPDRATHWDGVRTGTTRL